ncbi:MAG: response regulator [Lachnospiraceae bacterium]|nr:response regulator [Lachnospiraceae bacterium]
MNNILIVDDEVFASKQLERVIKNVDKSADITISNNYIDALKQMDEKKPELVFLDIQMPGMNGLKLASKIKNINPKVNIVMVTAYKEYAYEAHQLYVSGYILKPAGETKIREVYDHLRIPITREPDKEVDNAAFVRKMIDLEKNDLFIRCFGNFEVFYKGQPLKFKRSYTKEVLAYLIDLNGATCTTTEICSILWEDEMTNDSKSKMGYFRHIWSDLKDTLAKIGHEDMLFHTRNAYAVIPGKINCDYYMALRKNKDAIALYQGIYMQNYSWAEERVGWLNEQLAKN